MEITQADRDALLREMLFVPCDTKEHLHTWVKAYLGLDLPGATVCHTDTDFEPSNSNPMDLLWEVYEAARTKDRKKTRFLYYAARGCYKCTEKGTLLLSEGRGLVPIEEVKIGEKIWSGRAWRTVTHWIHDGIKDSRKLTTETGVSVTGSPIHRIWSWTKTSGPDWEQLNRLNVGDWVCVDTTAKYNRPINQEDYDLGYLCGILQGDGCLTMADKRRGYRVLLSNVDGYVRRFWYEACLKYAGKAPRTCGSKVLIDTIINSKEFTKFLWNLGLKQSYAHEKEVPKQVLENHSKMVGFVSGLLDTDGSIDKNGNVILSINAGVMAQQVHKILLALGVSCYYRANKKLYGKQNHIIHTIFVSSHNVPSLGEAGIFIKAKKANSGVTPRLSKDNVNDQVPRDLVQPLLDRLPKLKAGRTSTGKTKPRGVNSAYPTLSRAKLRRIIDWAEDGGFLGSEEIAYWREIASRRWVRVRSIDNGTADFYDLTVEEDHSYWSNGVISHNSIIASVIECLCFFHLRRDVGHMAANKAQSKIVQTYLRQYLQRPVLREFMTSKNESEISVTWYERGDRKLSPSQYKKLEDEMPEEAASYVEKTYMTKVVVATLGGTNGLHCSMMCVDGSTKVLVESSDGVRTRKSISARGIFNQLIGLGSGGSPLGPSAPDMSIEVKDPNARILSMNLKTGAMEFKPIVHAIRRRTDTLSIKAGNKRIVCSKDHPIWVIGKGFVQASELQVGDRTATMNKLNSYEDLGLPEVFDDRESVEDVHDDEWEQVLLGTLLGDTGIYIRDSGNPYLSVQHCLKQEKYLEWKISVLSNRLRFVKKKNAISGYTGKELVGYFSGHSPYLMPYLKLRSDLDGLEKLGPRGLAVWYMDDGCDCNGFRLSTECWNKEENQVIADFLSRRFGISTIVLSYTRGDKEYFYLSGGVSAKRRLVGICKPFIHPDLAYKFNVSRNTGICKVCSAEYWYYEVGGCSIYCGGAICRRIRKKSLGIASIDSIDSAGVRWVYDFTVEDNHNFWGNGILNKNCMDELDLTPAEIISEAAMIPAPGKEDGEPAMVLMTSSRKFAIGPVQTAIDNAHKTNIQIRRWNIIDVTASCPTERHRPDLPKLKVYYSNDTLQTIKDAEYQDLPEEERKGYKPDTAYDGCVSNCRIFAMCRGRLATEQTCDTPLLRDVQDTQDMFVGQPDVEKAQSQLMNWRPSRAGMIYPRLSRKDHLLTASEIATKMTGDEYPPTFGKAELIQLLSTQEVGYFTGIDHGYNHCFAGVLGVKWGTNMFVIDAFEIPGLELDGKIRLMESRLKQFNPVVFADTSHPGDNKSIGKHGFRMKKLEKGPGSVVDGIGIVRMKLNPVLSRGPELYFLKGDIGVEVLFDRLLKYAWVIDRNTGEPTNEPNEADDDGADALRYMVMSVFAPKGKVTVTKSDENAGNPLANPLNKLDNQQVRQKNWNDLLVHAGLGVDDAGNATGEDDPAESKSSGKKGGFLWEM